MNYWTQLSVELANQKNYLDMLFKIYPLSSNVRREVASTKWENIQTAFDAKNNKDLIKELLGLDLFPIKDSYVAYLKRDRASVERNPETVNRLAGMLYEMGLNEIFEKCSAPKETNRQVGPLFKRWISTGALGVPVFTDPMSFLNCESNCVLNCSDSEMARFAEENLGYNHDKGLDFVAKFGGKYIIGEAKFLTDFGGHQDSQFADAVSTITAPLNSNKLGVEVIKIAICDGVLYITSKNKMHKYLNKHDDQIILSGLLLRDFLYSI